MSFELVGVKLVADDAAQYFSAMEKADKATTGFGDTSSGVFKQMPGLSDIAVGALHKIGEVAVNAFMAAGQAAIGFAVDSVSAAGDFEAGMNTFTAVAGGALDEAGLKTKDFKDLFLTLGKELPVSTADVQKAATEMIKGGIDPATVAAGGLKQNIQFAAAAMEGDLVAAAEVSAKILGGWAEQGATAAEKAALLTDATDLLTKAANASTVDVKELALGLYNVQGTAKTTGLSLKETTTALAELSPRFASSSEAGTSFKNFLVRLQPTTKPAIAAMSDLGLMTTSTTKIMQYLQKQGIQPLGTDLDTLGNQFTEFTTKQGFTAKETGKVWDTFAQSAFFDDATGKFVGVAEASQLLQDATKDLTDAQKVQALQQIFGNDAMNSAAAFAEMGAKGFDDMTAAMEKQNGVSATAQTMQAGYKTALDNVHGSIEALQITIGSLLLPILTSLFNDYISPGINMLTDLSAALSGDADAFNKLSPVMQTVALTLEQVWAGIQEGMAIVDELIAAFQSTGDESGVLGGVLNDLSGIWDTLQHTIETVAGAYQDVMGAVLPIVSQFIEDHGDEIMEFFETTYDTITDIINLALELYEKIVVAVLADVAKFIADHHVAILGIITNAWTIIKNVINVALELIKGILKAALAAINGDWQSAWNAITEMSANVVKDLWEIIKAGLDLIANVFGSSLEEISNTWANNWNHFMGAIDTNVSALVGFFTSLPDRVANVGAAIVQAIWDGFSAAWTAFMDDLNQQLQDLQDLLPGSEPKDPTSPLRGLARRGRAMVEMLQMGVDQAGPLTAPGMSAPAMSAASLMAGGNTNTSTYNQQRSLNLSYHTQAAPPVNQSMAIANALGY